MEIAARYTIVPMDEELQRVLREVDRIVAREPRLIELQSAGTLVLAGDTHGDSDASAIVLTRYRKPGTTIVFLGDYVDRGPRSRENLLLLLRAKIEHPREIFLLQGNHEGWSILPFFPSDFWEHLDPEDRTLCGEVLTKLPYAVSTANGLIALHGALPGVPVLEHLNEVPLGSDLWEALTWGDYQDVPGTFLGNAGGRPQFGRNSFEELMNRFGRRVLVRGHQPTAPLFLFEDRCVTLFTSCAYALPRRVALVDLRKELRSSKDLQIEEI